MSLTPMKVEVVFTVKTFPPKAFGVSFSIPLNSWRSCPWHCIIDWYVSKKGSPGLLN